jgi:hypothetical protein
VFTSAVRGEVAGRLEIFDGLAVVVEQGVRQIVVLRHLAARSKEAQERLYREGLWRNLTGSPPNSALAPRMRKPVGGATDVDCWRLRWVLGSTLEDNLRIRLEQD